MNLEQLEQKLQEWRDKLPVLRRIASELRENCDLSVSASLVVSVEHTDEWSTRSSIRLSDLTEDSFAEYRVSPFHFTGVTVGGDTCESTDPSEAEKTLSDNRFDTVDLTINGKLYEFRTGHAYTVDADLYSFDRSPCWAACRVVRTIRKEGSVKFADLGHKDSIEMETIEL